MWTKYGRDSVAIVSRYVLLKAILDPLPTGLISAWLIVCRRPLLVGRRLNARAHRVDTNAGAITSDRTPAADSACCRSNPLSLAL